MLKILNPEPRFLKVWFHLSPATLLLLINISVLFDSIRFSMLFYK